MEQSLSVYASSENWVIGSINYQLIMAGFMVVHAVWIGRIFSNIEKLNVATLMWRLFMISMTSVMPTIPIMNSRHIKVATLSFSILL
ncbi:MAG: hypothetical protein AAFV78_15390, partial [Bacteroidota bacterium]